MLAFVMPILPPPSNVALPLAGRVSLGLACAWLLVGLSLFLTEVAIEEWRGRGVPWMTKVAVTCLAAAIPVGVVAGVVVALFN